MSFSFGGATNQPQQKPAFGNFSFGGGFGQQTQTAPTTSAPAFNFGTASTSTAPAFGAATTSTGFGGFGTAAPAFGTSTAQPSFGFGTSGGFNAPKTTTGLFSFNAPTTTQAGGSAFGGGFGTSAFGTSAFGTGGIGGFGQPQLQQQQMQMMQQQPAPLSSDEAFTQAIFNVSIFGDERDTIIARWNYLQAIWGTGKAFYSQNQPAVDITQQNHLCRFKTIGYSRLSGKDNKIGLVALVLNKPIGQVKDQQQQVQATLTQIFGSKPSLNIAIETIKALSETKSQILIYVEEKSPSGTETKRYPATEVAAFLNQPTPRNQLNSLAVENLFAFVPPDEDHLKDYLETPPKGIDARMWRQAKEDNPDPAKFIPVPMIGFNELKWRLKCQEAETDTHAAYLAKVDREVAELKQRHTNTSAKIMEHRRKLSELSHRILKVVVKQESTRKMGVSLSPQEEMLRSKLESMHTLVSAPMQFKGRLSELLSQMRMQRNQWRLIGGMNEYSMDKESTEEMKNFLAMQQKAMQTLIEMVNKDLKDLKVIQEGIPRLSVA